MCRGFRDESATLRDMRGLSLASVVLLVAACRPSTPGQETSVTSTESTDSEDSAGSTAESESSGPGDVAADPDLPAQCDPNAPGRADVEEIAWMIEAPFPTELWGLGFNTGVLGQEDGNQFALYAHVFSDNDQVADQLRTIRIDPATGDMTEVREYPRGVSASRGVRSVDLASDGQGFYVLDQFGTHDFLLTRVTSTSLEWTVELDSLPSAGSDGFVQDTDLVADAEGVLLAAVSLGYQGDDANVRTVVHRYGELDASPEVLWNSGLVEDGASRVLLGEEFLVTRVGGDIEARTQAGLELDQLLAPNGESFTPLSVADEQILWLGFRWSGDLLPRAGIFEPGVGAEQVWQTERCGELYPTAGLFIDQERVLVITGERSIDAQGTIPNRQYFSLIDTTSGEVLDERVFESEFLITSVLLAEDGASPELLVGLVERFDGGVVEGHLARIRPFE